MAQKITETDEKLIVNKIRSMKQQQEQKQESEYYYDPY